MANQTEFEMGLNRIAQHIREGSGSFDLARNPKDRASFALSAGSHHSIQMDRGMMVSIVLSRGQLQQLRDKCNELLGGIHLM
jgi:hypothetical protein